MYTRASTNSPGPLINPPTYIEYKDKRFLIVDAPSKNNLPLYIQAKPLTEKKIEVHDWVFGDGEAPPSHIVDVWLDLIESRFTRQDHTMHDGNTPCIATHCVAGLGRAPVLVAIALIEEGMPALDAVAYIRERRRGAINNKQLKFIEAYRPRSKSRCIIS
ncbi:Protein tyrosine phosphatase type IVA 1 [Apophysomyces ossiformis]|uniref:Protein tyrosine phosphatase type IVA 3 n=1 Tax=Apophysomyces ossiformis TaxID=679940 RepID=A0A8H7BVZ0_9FUNG|nr:Protein tyrosine phosphatase type IVA 1 [Apophysomyces ossiformis]